MNAGQPELDYELARAIQLSLEMESAFGVDHLPKGERFEAKGLNPSAAPAPQVSPQAASTAAAAQIPAPNPVQESVSTAPAPVISQSEPEALAQLNLEIAACESCNLSQTRKQVVPGQGNPKARLMFIGEAPGADEDLSGEAFVGQAGQLLTKMIGAMGLSRDDVFIANILKCRPPEDRNPRIEEAQACSHFLERQIELIKPEVICTLGSQALNHLLQRTEPIGKMRGQTLDFYGAKLVPTYHPAYLLREPSAKRPAWQDLQRVMGLLGLG
ncbi:MAG: uracil-DNA glycosylase family 4 [Planctomycetota bacterium]|jgi:uracil-DNA glycosylase family 4